MGTVYVFANQKGGVGKTTSAVNLGAYLADKGKRVLLIDFDPQGNLSSSIGADRELPGVYEVLTESRQARSAIQQTTVSGLDCISSSINLTGANVELVEYKDREFYLKRALESVREEYDYCFIDCPPSLGLLTVNGLVAADKVIIPLQCEYFALEGLSLLLQTVRRVQGGLNRELAIGGILFTMYDTRTRLAHEVVEEVTGYFKDVVFKTIIPRNVRLSEAPSYAVPISQYDKDCVGARSYKALAEEVIARG
ncbi:MAG: AAA family ATPase [Spirochaetales bacterium]|nr:AAA family ATPase [Spirochaetales bacterium]MCF7939770.1 AAA family ATPase [Spirochaetales bacterium]